MEKKHIITKASGEIQQFDKSKLENSLRKSGASTENVSKIIAEILPLLTDGISTRKIYSKAYSILKQKNRSSAARYSLKKAIMDLGPTGFPFEHLIGQLLKQQGFEVLVGQIVQGQCIQHEVDVVATSGNKQYLVECKFYNDAGKYANVQVPLYIHSRVNDIIKKRSALPEYKDLNFYGWIVTNTRFTTDAVDYGRCAGLNLMSWDYPVGHSLKDMIEKNGFYPVTALTTLEKIYKLELLKRDIVLCRQIKEKPELLELIGITGNKLKKVLDEVNDLCV